MLIINNINNILYILNIYILLNYLIFILGFKVYKSSDKSSKKQEYCFFLT